MLHRSTLDKASRPGLRFQNWKALPVGSKIAIIVLGLIALIAILAPVIAPYSPRHFSFYRVVIAKLESCSR